MATEAQVYDFETAIENAVADVFTEAGITVAQPSDDPAFEKTTPRVEVQFLSGQATGHLQHVTLDGKNTALVHDSYTGQLLISCLTKAQHAEHVSFRAQVRAIGARIIYLATLAHHEIHDVTPNGTGMVIMPEEGYFESRLQYSIGFCVKHTAWPIT